MGDLQLGADVAQGVLVASITELLSDLVPVRLGERSEARRRREPPGQLLGDRIRWVADVQVADQPLDGGFPGASRWCGPSDWTASPWPQSTTVCDCSRRNWAT